MLSAEKSREGTTTSQADIQLGPLVSLICNPADGVYYLDNATRSDTNSNITSAFTGD